MKRAFLLKGSIFVLVFLVALTTLSITPVNAAYVIDGPTTSGYIDYSGQGTVIESPLRDGVSTISGDYLNVPTYKGKYENQQVLVNDWWLHSWSSWSTTNNRTNDYYTYRGESITEYDVESKDQSMYKRYDPEKYPVYTKYYVTEYIGNKWYNFFLTTSRASTVAYPGAIDNYDITNRYTELRVTSYNGGYEYDYTWRDSKPSSNTGYEWISWSNRTVYRYRSRTITWNETAINSTERVPLKYSFNDLEGNSLGIIKLTLNKKISEYEDISNVVSNNLDQYFITSESIIDLLIEHVEDIDDQVTQMGFQDLGDLIIYVLEIGITASLPPELAKYIGPILFALEYIDNLIITKMALNQVNTMQDFLFELNNSNNIGVINFTTIEVNTGYGYDISYYLTTDIVDLDYVSMRYDYNDVGNLLMDLDGNNYGIVKYDISLDEIIYIIQITIMDSYPTILPWNTIIF
jgi:hypothetical protein